MVHSGIILIKYRLEVSQEEQMLRAGVPPESVQLWLGHHAAAFTLDTYGHLLSDDLPDGEVLDRFVNGEGVNTGSTSPPDKTGEVVVLPQPKTT